MKRVSNRVKGIDLRRRIQTLLWILSATVALSCSMAAGALPGGGPDTSIRDLNSFLPPSPTPFLPVFATKTALLLPSATSLPSVEITRTPTFTVFEILTGTDTPAPTLTIVILPSVTPTNNPPAYNPPPFNSPTKTGVPKVYPTATLKPSATQKPAATATGAGAANPPSATKTPTATDAEPYPPPADPNSPTPTATLSGNETATSTAVASPTATPTPTPTSVDPYPPPSEPTNPFPGCTYTLNVDFENQIYERINQARAEAGLWSLSWYGPLAEGARYHSIDMGCNKYFAHTGGVYENILGGYNTVEQAWNWWWNSPAHHDNILGRYYYKTGVGYAWVTGSPYRYYWTIQFSR
jgi:uncharacterized protein YkwD